MGSYRVSPDAEDDLYRIWAFGVERWGVDKADQYCNALFDRFEELAEDPLLYPAVDEIRDGYRRNVCGVDNIFYRIVDGAVEIMAVIGMQDLNEWL